MKKMIYAVKRLDAECKAMYKPNEKTLMKDSCRIAGTAVIAAVLLRFVDVVLAAFLNLIL